MAHPPGSSSLWWPKNDPEAYLFCGHSSSPTLWISLPSAKAALMLLEALSGPHSTPQESSLWKGFPCTHSPLMPTPSDVALLSRNPTQIISSHGLLGSLPDRASESSQSAGQDRTNVGAGLRDTVGSGSIRAVEQAVQSLRMRSISHTLGAGSIGQGGKP